MKESTNKTQAHCASTLPIISNWMGIFTTTVCDYTDVSDSFSTLYTVSPITIRVSILTIERKVVHTGHIKRGGILTI